MIEQYLLGVTGSMGCGKSYACKKLIQMGQGRGVDIVHIDFDAVRRANSRRYDALQHALCNAQGLVLLEWALLVEDNLLSLVHNNVLLVTSDYDAQLSRLTDADLPMEEVLRRINIQLSNKEKEAKTREAQAASGSGKLFTFDTSHNPRDEEYSLLLERILEDRQHGR